MSEAPVPFHTLDRVDEARIFGWDSTNSVFRSLAVDANGQPKMVTTDANGTTINPATEPTLASIADALASNAADTLRTEQQTPVGVENSAGTQIDPLAASDQPLDVSGATVPTEQQTPVGVEDSTGTQISPLAASDQPLDVSGATVTTRRQGTNLASLAFENGTAMASGGSVSNSLGQPGADTLRGRVTRATTSYDVTVDWEDSAGNVLFTDTIASGAAAGSTTSLNEPAISPYCTVTVADSGSGSGAVTATIHLR